MPMPLENFLHERLLEAAKRAAWTNVDVESSDDPLLTITPRLGALIAVATTSHQYADYEGAVDSMVGISHTLKVPLRLWQTPQGRFIFVHALLDLKVLDCLYMSTHHPSIA